MPVNDLYSVCRSLVKHFSGLEQVSFLLRNRRPHGPVSVVPGMHRDPEYSPTETIAKLSRALDIILKGPNIKRILATDCLDTIDLKAAAAAILIKNGKVDERLVVED